MAAKTYRVFISASAEKQLKRLPGAWQRRISAVILSLEIEPRPYGCRKMAGAEDCYRIRVGSYRIIYEVRDLEITVTVLKVAHRRDAYR